MNKKSSGYVLVLVLFIISMSAALITAVVKSSFAYQRQAYYSLDAQKAKLLASSGLQLALDQISVVEPEKKQESDQGKPDNQAKSQGSKADQEPEKKEQESIEKRLFQKIIKIVDKSQTIKLAHKDFGVDGEIEMYISCEQGKINLRQLVSAIKFQDKKTDQKDSEKNEKKEEQEEEKTKAEVEKQPEKTYPSVISDLVQKEAKVQLVESIKELLKKRPAIEDPTELLLASRFKELKNRVFLTPDVAGSKKQIQVYLMDLFTVGSGSGRINPWLLSRSLSKVLGFDYKPRDNELRDKFKMTMSWATDWDKVLAPIYGKNYASIDQEIQKMLAPTFEVSAFSVFVKASVGQTTQQVYALCERDKKVTGVSPKSFVFKITKIYWL